jgi:hypothetical protein
MRVRDRVAASALLGGAILTLCSVPLAAQAAAADTSVSARLERAERMIEVLRQQVAEQAAARVEPKSGNRIELSGIVLMNGFFNNAKVNSPDIPTFVQLPDPPGFLPNSSLGGTARQSEVALTAIAPSVLRGTFTGELSLDFYGGHQNFARLFPLAHLKRTRAELRWPHAWLVFGQESPPISELNPSSFAARGVPGFTNAGNLWFWIPQARLGGDFGGAVRIGLEVAALAPVTTEAPVTFNPEPSRAERSLRPFAQGRVLLKWDRPRSDGEVSLGVHYGWIATTADTLLITRAAAAAVRFTLTQYIEIRGEAFLGQALAGLGGGGIGQNLNAQDKPIRARGGWVQLNLMPRADVEIGGGYGFDDPDDADLPVATARLKNVSLEGHLHYRPGPLVLAVEFRRVETSYSTPGRLFVHHLNVGMGFRF